MPEPGTSPLPVPDLAANPEIRPYIDGLLRRALVLPRCRHCAFLIWYPRALCPECGSLDVEWIEVDGTGHIYSYTTVHRAAGAFEGATPFSIAYVELSSGPRILTNIIGPIGHLAIGCEVVADIDGPATRPILRFHLSSASGEGVNA